MYNQIMDAPTSLTDYVALLRLASSRTSRGPYCCHMSHAGAEVLRSLGFKAEVLVCAVRVSFEAGGEEKNIWLGHSAASVALLGRTVAAPESDAPPGYHMIIESSGPNERARVDLTIGQVQLGLPIRIVPWTMAWFAHDWMRVTLPNTVRVSYSDCPHLEQIPAGEFGRSYPELASRLRRDMTHFQTQTAWRVLAGALDLLGDW